MAVSSFNYSTTTGIATIGVSVASSISLGHGLDVNSKVIVAISTGIGHTDASGWPGNSVNEDAQYFVGSHVVTKIKSWRQFEINVGASATATVSPEGIITDINITNPGFGYSNMAPPQVIIDEPKFKTEKVNGFDQFEGYTGIITGITQITRWVTKESSSKCKIFNKIIF